MAKDRRAEPICLKEQAAERWVARRLGRIEHERRVAAIATTLFDLTSDLHGLGAAERRMLRLGCILHDVGRSIDRKSHPAKGARMIARDTWLPLTTAERRCVCYLTRYHRGAIPQNGYDEWLENGDDRKAMRRILALLRAADALDSRSIVAPQIVFAMKGRRIGVTCYLDQDHPKARRVYTRRKKFRLLEETLGLRVQVQIELAEVVHAVA
jgi:exopolyphosphatase/pppGpp-phosphohydrolase